MLNSTCKENGKVIDSEHLKALWYEMMAFGYESYKDFNRSLYVFETGISIWVSKMVFLFFQVLK